jgi:hypothetical protein
MFSIKLKLFMISFFLCSEKAKIMAYTVILNDIADSYRSEMEMKAWKKQNSPYFPIEFIHFYHRWTFFNCCCYWKFEQKQQDKIKLVSQYTMDLCIGKSLKIILMFFFFGDALWTKERLFDPHMHAKSVINNV